MRAYGTLIGGAFGWGDLAAFRGRGELFCYFPAVVRKGPTAFARQTLRVRLFALLALVSHGIRVLSQSLQFQFRIHFDLEISIANLHRPARVQLKRDDALARSFRIVQIDAPFAIDRG